MILLVQLQTFLSGRASRPGSWTLDLAGLAIDLSLLPDDPAGVCAVKGVGFLWVRIPPGNLVVLAGKQFERLGGRLSGRSLRWKRIVLAIQRACGP